MKQENRRNFFVAVGLLALFALWTHLVCVVDVRAIGPQDSAVGFAGVNGWVHSLTGVHMTLYTITDWLGLVPIGFALGFAILGLTQWIKRKQIQKVDVGILLLGGLYLAVMGAYILFEYVVINYRPVLLGGFLEVSYPSSTTMLVLCVMPTAVMQFRARIKNPGGRGVITVAIWAFVVLMVVGRLLDGVHWFSDIVGGALLSAGLVMLYGALCNICRTHSRESAGSM